MKIMITGELKALMEQPRVEIEITEFRADVGIGPYENGAQCAPLQEG